MEIDEVNSSILNLLQKDCRMSLSDIARHVGLSVDSVKKRIVKMQDNGIFFAKVQLRPRNFGYKNVVEAKIKLSNHSEESVKHLIASLKSNPNVVEIIQASGAWDFSIVIIAKDAIHQGKVTSDIRSQFSDIIGDWEEALTTCVYKFEEYDLARLNDDE